MAEHHKVTRGILEESVQQIRDANTREAFKSCVYKGETESSCLREHL